MDNQSPTSLDQETDRSLGNEIDVGGSVVVTVPTVIRTNESTIENENYLQPGLFTNRTTTISTFKPLMANPVIIGFCQTDFQPLDPKLLLETTVTKQEDLHCTQSVQLTTYDSGFIDELNLENSNSKILNPISTSDNDDMILTKSEIDDDTTESHSKEIKWKNIEKHVSFQGSIDFKNKNKNKSVSFVFVQ